MMQGHVEMIIEITFLLKYFCKKYIPIKNIF